MKKIISFILVFSLLYMSLIVYAETDAEVSISGLVIDKTIFETKDSNGYLVEGLYIISGNNFYYNRTADYTIAVEYNASNKLKDSFVSFGYNDNSGVVVSNEGLLSDFQKGIQIYS